MLLQFNLIPRLAKVYDKGRRFVGVELKWNKNFQQVVVKKRHIKRVLWFLGFVVVTAADMQSVKDYQSANDIGSMSFAIFGMAAATISIFYAWYVPKNSVPIAEFMNGLIITEKRYNKGALRETADIVMKVVNLIFITVELTISFCPIPVGLAASVLPCSPINFLSAFMHARKTCEQSGEGNGDITDLLAMGSHVNMGVWHFTLMYGSISCLHMLLGSVCQEKFLNMWKRMIATRHTSPTKRSTLDVVLFYRQIELINYLFNTSHVGILVTLLMIAIVSQAILFYFLLAILLGMKVPWAITVSLSVMCFDTVIVILGIYGAAARVHSTSVSFERG